jgi:hypothetical protein
VLGAVVAVVMVVTVWLRWWWCLVLKGEGKCWRRWCEDRGRERKAMRRRI